MPTADYNAQVDSLLKSDPILQQISRQMQQTGRGNRGYTPAGSQLKQQYEQRSAQVLQATGISSLPKDYYLDPFSNTIQKSNFVSRNADWIIPAFSAAVAIPAAMSFMGPSAATSTAGGVSEGARRGVEAASAGGNGFMNGVGNLLSNPDFWSTLVGGGLGLYGANKAAEAADRAAEYQDKALQRAIDLQRDMYQQDRNDRAPYRAAGQGSIGRLGHLLAVPGFESGATAFQPQPGPFDQPPRDSLPTLPPAGQSMNLGNLGQASPGVVPPQMQGMPGMQAPSMPPPMGGQMVTLQAPDGEIRQFPMSEAQRLIARGARRLA